jgi:hypothetical protein
MSYNLKFNYKRRLEPKRMAHILTRAQWLLCSDVNISSCYMLRNNSKI